MKTFFFIPALCGIFCFSAIAQDLPQLSPAATVSQRVGLSDFSIEYSRPGVKGRAIFGDLVPYGKVWRTGANKASLFTASTDFMFGSVQVEARNLQLVLHPP